jgi:hypothetical protein
MRVLLLRGNIDAKEFSTFIQSLEEAFEIDITCLDGENIILDLEMKIPR